MQSFSASEPMRLGRFSPSKATPVKDSVLGKAAKRQWVHVCKVTDDANGQPISKRFLELYVADYYSTPDAGPVYVGHCDADAMPGQEEPPARAWILAMELTKSGDLFALYEMTDWLAGEIKAGHYRYSSIFAGYELDAEGEVAKVQFRSVAVVNSPAVAGLQPLAAAKAKKPPAKACEPMTDAEIVSLVISELPDDATFDQIAAAFRHYAAQGTGHNQASIDQAGLSKAGLLRLYRSLCNMGYGPGKAAIAVQAHRARMATSHKPTPRKAVPVADAEKQVEALRLALARMRVAPATAAKALAKLRKDLGL